MSKELTSEQKTERAAYTKQYHRDHKDEIHMRQKRYRQDNKLEIAAQKKRYQQDNKVEIAAKKKLYNQAHRAEITARDKRYRQNHKPEIAAYHQDHKSERNISESNRKAIDIDYKLKTNFTSKIGQSIKGTKQYEHSIDLLGCAPEYAHEYLEKQFQPGMSWDNYGLHGWHIDHIIPLSYFNFADYEQQKRAFHYTNLRPLWAEENLRKGSKIIEKQLILI